jgi:metallophosphoesterase (TIGR00282 family)
LVRILFIGDIVGKPGKQIVLRCLEPLREREQIDFVVANAENCEDGSGLKPGSFQEFCNNGVDVVTLGDHIYKKRVIFSALESDDRIVKPANFPAEAPGKPWTIAKTKQGIEIAVFSLLGRVFMRPVDCPFTAADRVLNEIPETVKVRFLDFHAEATSDKQLIGRYLDGKVSAADEQILPGGTAFQCDVGMTGPHDSIIGRDIERVLETTITFKPRTFKVPNQNPILSATLIDVDEQTGLALNIRRISVNEKESRELAENQASNPETI